MCIRDSVFPLAQGTPGKQCGLAATGVYQPSLRSPWLAADDGTLELLLFLTAIAVIRLGDHLAIRQCATAIRPVLVVVSSAVSIKLLLA